MRIISVINQKGGVGKSTTVLSLGVGISLKGLKVLFIDLDAQGNLSHTIGVDNSSGFSSMDVLEGKVSVKEAIQRVGQSDIIANSPALAAADTVITSTGKEYRLKEALEPLKGEYDYVLIDTPPALGILTINALTACTGCIIPAQADIYSLQGISQLYNTIQAVQKYCNPFLRVMGILLTRYNNRVIISREVAEMMEQTAGRLNARLYKARIRETTAVRESQAVRKDIFAYSHKCNAAQDYAAFVSEVLED